MIVKVINMFENESGFTLGSKEAACFDLKARKIEQISKTKVKVYLGIKTEIPEGYKAVLVPRSSFTHKGWVMQNSPAQIDSDYRGEWMVKFEAIPIPKWFGLAVKFNNFPYKVGERCVQAYFQKNQQVKLKNVKEINITERKSGGFGSTGK